MDPHLQICQHLLLSGVDPSLFLQSCQILTWSQSSGPSQILTPSWHKAIKHIKPNIQRQTLCYTALQYHVKYLTIMLREVVQQQLADMSAKYLCKEIQSWNVSKVNNELGTKFLKSSHKLNWTDDAFYNGYMSVYVCAVTTVSLYVCLCSDQCFIAHSTLKTQTSCNISLSSSGFRPAAVSAFPTSSINCDLSLSLGLRITSHRATSNWQQSQKLFTRDLRFSQWYWVPGCGAMQVGKHFLTFQRSEEHLSSNKPKSMPMTQAASSSETCLFTNAHNVISQKPWIFNIFYVLNQ